MKKLSTISTCRICAALLAALAFSTGSSAHIIGTYQQHNLVANTAGTADVTDPNLVNPWGMAFNPFGFVWVANNGTGTSTLYDGAGAINPLVVQIPSATDITGGRPTGMVFNGSPEFVVAAGEVSGAGRFIFATEEGLIAAWAPAVDATHAIRVNDPATTTGAVYKGLAISANGTGGRLYAADFFNNKVDVFDGTFRLVTLPTGAFTDPALPSGFAPFGIQAINGSIYVAYAMQDESRLDEVKGVGLGFVNVFDTNGQLIKRLISQGNLNAPWGMALAPSSFGEFGDRLLVGNFGDGTINAFDLVTGGSIGPVSDANGSPLVIDGLWALSFGNGYLNQPVNTLFFTAGPNDEQNGLYGRIDTLTSVTPGTGTGTGTPAFSSTGTGTGTPTFSSTGTGTGTPTFSSTGTGTGTPTFSSTGTDTGTPTFSSTGTDTGTPAFSSTGTDTGTPAFSSTGTDTGTPTFSSTGTDTGTPTFSGTGTGTGSGTGTFGSTSTGTGTDTGMGMLTRSP